jgi:hypothetical protein
MAWVLARAASVARSVLGFLGGSPFRLKRPAFEAWISLDFLGFSRQNRVFSMGYAGSSLKKFCARLSGRWAARRRAQAFLGCGRRDWSWSKLSQISDFRQ